MEALKREITLAKAPLIQLQASSRTNNQEIDKNRQDQARTQHIYSAGMRSTDAVLPCDQAALKQKIRDERASKACGTVCALPQSKHGISLLSLRVKLILSFIKHLLRGS
jgi:hypothetical protein